MIRDYRVRRATIDDLDEIAALTHVKKAKWFGNKRPKYGAKDALFKSYQTHRMVVETNQYNTDLVAYAEFRNYPAIGPLPSDCWLEWLHQRYCISDPISMMNTLFFNYCIYDINHPNTLLEILREVFYFENRITFVITVRMPDIPHSGSSYYAESFDDLEQYAKVFFPREFSIGSNKNTQSLYIIHRYGLLPRITYRKALAEDNDDIIEIHEVELPEMKAELGGFYIAEELMRQDEVAKNNVLIVAETENELKNLTTCGFLWLESEVDIRFYVRNYEMETFGNLLKFNPSKPYNFETIQVFSVVPKDEANLFTADAMDDLESSTIIGGVQRNDSGVSVASASKFKVSSIHGTIVDYSKSVNKFYSVEMLYRKFMYIFEKLITIKYYIDQQKKSINLYFNTDGSKCVDGVQKASNVFALKFVCAHKDFPLKRLFNYLCAMFSVFPDKDYCILAMPKSIRPMRSHLEALRYFMPVAQRPSDMSNLDDIYITHRSTIFGEISLYRLERGDVETVHSLAMNFETEKKSLSQSSSFSFSSKVNTHAHSDNELRVVDQIMEDVLENESSEFAVFTIRCGNSMKPAKENTAIGYVIVKRFLHHHELHKHYHLPKHDYHLAHERAEIISLKLHPLFHNSCDVIFRNLSGKTKYFDFYYFRGRKKHIFSNDLKTAMMLVEPNPRKKFWFNTNTIPQRNSVTIEGLPRYDYNEGYQTIFRHKLNPSKFFGNTNRLVIIGFSAECRAFLRQLVFMWNSKDHKNSETFTCLPRLQVTVIAEPGKVEAEYECTFLCPECGHSKNCYMYYENNSCYVRDVVARMDLRYYVHFVSGHVNFINRDKKFVKINKSCDIFYDTLLLMNSLKFSLKNTLPFDESGRKPYNFIQLNHRIDKFILFYKVRVLLDEMKRNYRILIYGSNLSTYECIAFLISHGVSPTQVVLVHPHVKLGTEEEQKYKNPTNDQNIEYILDDMVEDLDITIYRDLNFLRWNQHGASNFIIEVVFTDSQKNEILFDCNIFISFHVGYLDPNVKKWLIDSYISVNENRILVNQHFQTNDPDIYAVGKFIEFNKPVNHQYRFTSEMEVAQKLMHILGFRQSEKPFEEKYSQPAFFRAMLPMDYFITKVTMPCRYLASCINCCLKCSLTTYHNNTFCRIGLSPKMVVDEIVVVTKENFSIDYLEHFCGKHEKMLNNLKSHYKAGNIKCFFKFFQEPWTELLMHENFENFQEENHKMLRPIMEQTLELDQVWEETQFHEVNQHILEQNLLEFVRTHRKDFYNEFALPEDYQDKPPQ